MLPQEGESQHIGKKAGRAFVAKLPDNWIQKDQDGDADFGIDYLIQLISEDDCVAASFYLQLKGTTNPTFVANGKEISHQFDSSTLNLYRESEPAVMVAIVDLSVDEKPRNCPVYYKWLDEDFLDSITERREKNDQVNIRVPVANILDESLDVLPYYRRRLETRESLISLRRAVEQYSDNPVSDIEALAENVKVKPVILELSRDDSGAPWITNPEDLVAGKLSQVSEAISANRIVVAESLLKKVQRETNLSNHEKAELLSLQGTILTLKGADEEAVKYFDEAYQTHSESRYKINFYESTFRKGKIPDKETLGQYVDNLDVKIYKECVLKAKCLAILGQENEALNCLDNHASDKTSIAKLLILTISGNTEEFDKFSAAINVDELSDRQKFLYYSFIGRRYFYRGVNSKYSSDGDEALPAKGRREYNYELLGKALECIESALHHAKDKGYPYDTYVILDVSISLFSFFNRENKLISYLESILQDRPESIPIISALIPLKFNTNKYEDAIKLIGNLKEKSAEHISIQISANYHAGNKFEVVNLVNNNKELLLDKKPQGYSALFCIAAQCAYELLDDAGEKENLEIVRVFENGEELLAIYEYIKNCIDLPEKRKELNQWLYQKYLSLNKPYSLAQQLYSHLDVEDPSESLIICDLATVIVGFRELYPDENITLAFALSQNKKWSELEALCNRIELRGDLDNLWSLFKASALDGMGRNAEALDLLDGSVSRERRSVERAEHYVNMCIHLGFFDKASDKLENLLEKSSPEKKLSILESLMFIYSSDPEPSERLIPTLLRYGKLVDQEDEVAEGRYLISFLTMTNRPGVDVNDYGDDFRERLNNYTQKFPDSKVLREGEISPESSGDAILDEMLRMAGITDDQVKKWRKNRNQIKSRKLPVPFSLLSNFLDDVGDIFSAWIMCKYCGYERKEYQLIHSKGASSEVVDNLGSYYLQVVLDETALLILDDLGILDIALKYLPGVIINKNTYEAFSRQSHAVMGSIYSSVPKKIIKTLGENLGRITLKGAVSQSQSNLDQYESILKELDSPVFCTDDSYMSMHLNHSGFTSINSVNVIDWLESKGLIEEAQKITAIEKLCSFMIDGVSIGSDHLLQVINFNLRTVGGSIFDTGFRTVFDAYFPPSKDTKTAIEELGGLFSSLLNVCNCEMKLDGLEDVINLWMFRYPHLDRIEMISIWFVMSAAEVNYISEGPLLRRGLGEAKLWSLVKKLTVEHDSKYTIQGVMSAVCIVILRLNPEMASNVYDKVKLAFTEGSDECDLFSSIYSEKAIKVRLAQVTSKDGHQ